MNYNLKNIISYEAVSYHIVPFYLEGVIGADHFSMPEDSFWERTSMNIDENVFYRHIQDFLMSSVTEGKSPGLRPNYEFLVYSLKESPLRRDITNLLKNDREFINFMVRHPSLGLTPEDADHLAEKWKKIDQDSRREALVEYYLQRDGQTLQKITVNRLLEQEFCLCLDDKEQRDGKVKDQCHYVPFKIADNLKTRTFDSPKLMVFPDASVGMLVIPVAFNTLKKSIVAKKGMPEQLKSPITMHDFMAANNVMVKSKKTKRRVMPLRSCGIKIMEQIPENQCTDEMKSFLEKEKKALVNTCSSIFEALNMDNSGHGGKVNDYANFSISFSDIIDFLLGLTRIKMERFNKKKSHIFTYFQIDEDAVPKDRLDNAGFHCDFIRIVRGEHANFQIIDDERERVYVQTFKNIYVGSSVEGGAILTLRSKFDDGKFIERFKEKSVDKRYFWIYILAYVQRMSLLNMVRELGGIDNTMDDNIIVPLLTLRDLYKRLSRIQVNTFYSAVSDISQHNMFYRLCTKNLGVDLLLNEVDNKMNILNKCLQQEFDEKKEKMQMADADLRAKEEAAKERMGHFITLSVLFLALFSGCCDLFDLLHKIIIGNEEYSNGIRWTTVAVLFFGLCVGIYFVRHIFIRRKKGE